jgi:hypothetical protein
MRLRLLLIGFLLMPLGISGCAALQQIAALRQVSFEIDQVDHVHLAGTRLDHLQSPQQVSPDAYARIAAAFATGQMPLSFIMRIGAENPADNPVAARLVRMDWTLLLDDMETISGIFEDERLIEPGEREILSLAMELDLMRFFSHNLQQLINLGMAMGGHGQQEVGLRFQPTVTTPFGPITYPGHITIRHTVGG